MTVYMTSHWYSPFTEEEYKKGIAMLKNKKAVGIDYVLVEQLKNL